MENFDTYKAIQQLNTPVKEYDIEDQITFDDILEELEDRNNF